jgi:two-component system, NtrC family, response regulator AtoC
MLQILLADDESSVRLGIAEALRDRGHHVVEAADGAEAQVILSRQQFDLLLTDVRMPKMNGMELFRFARTNFPSTDVVMMTGYGEVSQAVTALKEGAFDYLTTPVGLEEIIFRIDRLQEKRALLHQLESARAELRRLASGNLIGRSPAMVRLLETVDTVAQSDAPVMISGETGTGKELVARRIHELSARRSAPFVAVNCASFPDALLETELFGPEGRFKSAKGGTVMLDEVAEIPLPVQAKLLNVLQEGASDVRVVAATHRDLKERIQEGLFREDLFYRLNVLDISIPALRDREGDLPLLVKYFLDRFSQGKTAISPPAWAALARHPFYGNVRELEHAIERAVVLSRGQEIRIEHLPDSIAGETKHAPRPEGGGIRSLGVVLKEFEREYLLRALKAADGKKARAADMLGISRKNLWEKCKALGIED